MVEVSLDKLKEMKQEKKFTPEKKPSESTTTMFMPMNTNGSSILELKTRQSFLDEGINAWRQWKIYKIMSIGFAVLAVYLLFVNAWLAAVSGGLAGWYFGEYIRRDFLINKQMKSRDLYEFG